MLLLVLIVVASERWGGPLTVERIASAAASLGSAAKSALSDDPTPGWAGTIHLTFDDGPHLDYTPAILDVLADHDARATFFLIGNQVPNGEELVRRAAAEGHTIGNHTWNHDSLVGLDADSFDATVGRTQREIDAVAGITPQCLRPPGGTLDDGARRLVSEADLDVVMWNVDPSDWNDEIEAAEVVRRVTDVVADGDVVVLHDGGGDQAHTVEALPQILDELARRGFAFEPVPDC